MGAKGIVIHRQGCPNISSLPGERLIQVTWESEKSTTSLPKTYPVTLKLEVIDRVGVLKDILSHMSDLKINGKSGLQSPHFLIQIAEIDLGIDIKDHAHFEQVVQKLRKMTDILSIKRVRQID